MHIGETHLENGGGAKGQRKQKAEAKGRKNLDQAREQTNTSGLPVKWGEGEKERMRRDLTAIRGGGSAAHSTGPTLSNIAAHDFKPAEASGRLTEP